MLPSVPKGRLLAIWSDRCLDDCHLWQHTFNISFMHIEIENFLSIRQFVATQSTNLKSIDDAERVSLCAVEERFVTMCCYDISPLYFPRL